MASLTLATSEVLRAIGGVSGNNRDPAEWPLETQEDARQCIRDGLRKFFVSPVVDGRVHTWRFLERAYRKSYQAKYNTGTIALTAGTATITGGSWPAWVLDGVLRVDGHTLYVLTTVGATVTVSNTTLTLAAGTSFELHRWRYALPSDFGEFVGGLVYQHSNNGRYLRNVDESEIRLRYAANFQTGRTSMYAIVPGETVSDRGYLTFWPAMDEDSALHAVYVAAPADGLESNILSGLATVQADAIHAGTVLASILAVADEFFNDQFDGPYHRRFEERLRASIAHDRRYSGAVLSAKSAQADPEFLSLFDHTPTYNDLLP